MPGRLLSFSFGHGGGGMTRRRIGVLVAATVGVVVLLVAVAVGVGGCRGTSPTAAEPYIDLTLGAPIADATRLAGRDGEAVDHDVLPVRPLPRVLSPRLPADARWYVWWRERGGVRLYPELVIGVADGRVVYKQVSYEQDGTTRSAIRVSPEYQ
jgi:hypothetical protein